MAQPSAGRWTGLRQVASLHHFLVLTFSFQLLLVKESFWLHLIQNKIKSWIGISIRVRKCIPGCLLGKTSDRVTMRQEGKIKDEETERSIEFILLTFKRKWGGKRHPWILNTLHFLKFESQMYNVQINVSLFYLPYINIMYMKNETWNL